MIEKEDIKNWFAHEPQWLRKIRVKELKTYQKNPPCWKSGTKKIKYNDEWRFYDNELKEFMPEDLAIKFNNIIKSESVVCTTMTEAIRIFPRLLRKTLTLANGMDALSHALWIDGVFVYLPEGSSAQIETELISGKTAMRSVIMASPGSTLNYLEEVKTTNVFSCQEIYAKKGSHVSTISIQNNKDTSLYHRDFSCDTCSETENMDIVKGSNFSKTKSTFNLNERARCSNLSLFFGKNNNKIDISSYVTHSGHDSRSRTLAKGIMMDKSRSIYKGDIKIERKAYNSNADLLESIMLFDQSQGEAMPKMDILNDDVKATHGTAVMRIDKKQLYYMQTRGLSKKEAEKITALGFLLPVIEGLPLPVRDKLSSNISKMFDQ